MALSIDIDEDLELRLLEEHDAESLFAQASKTRVHLERWLPAWAQATGSVSDCRAVIRHSIQRHVAGSGHVFGIRNAAGLAGAIGLTMEAPWQGEIGYWLAPHDWGSGIATRSVRALTEYAFGRLRLNVVAIRCDESNARARAIPERLGFVLDGDDGSYRYPGHCVYTMLFDDWVAGNGQEPA